MTTSSKPSFFDKFLTTGFFAGYSPFAPGTMGALVATVMWVIGSMFIDLNTLYIITLWFCLLFTLGSIKPINRLEAHWGEDPSRVVVDEMVGVWICLLSVPFDTELFSTRYWIYVGLSFALFRLFDIWKPLGVRKMESLGGGWGVMMDDILAGCYGAIVLMTTRYFGL